MIPADRVGGRADADVEIGWYHGEASQVTAAFPIVTRRAPWGHTGRTFVPPQKPHLPPGRPLWRMSALGAERWWGKQELFLGDWRPLRQARMCSPTGQAGAQEMDLRA